MAGAGGAHQPDQDAAGDFQRDCKLEGTRATPLRDWICGPEVRKALVLDEEADQDLLDAVLTEGYGADLTEVDLEKIGSDAFLIAYALAERDRVVVTKETSRPKKTRGNRKIPDVCKTLDVECIHDFELYRRLDFSTA